MPSFLSLSLVRAPLCESLHQCTEDMKRVALCRSNGGFYVLLSHYLHYWVWCLIFLQTRDNRFIIGFRSGECAISHSNTSNWTSFWFFWQSGRAPCPAGKLNLQLQWAQHQKAAWSATELCVDFKKTWTYIIPDCGSFTRPFRQHRFCASPNEIQPLPLDH